MRDCPRAFPRLHAASNIDTRGKLGAAPGDLEDSPPRESVGNQHYARVHILWFHQAYAHNLVGRPDDAGLRKHQGREETRRGERFHGGTERKHLTRVYEVEDEEPVELPSGKKTFARARDNEIRTPDVFFVIFQVRGGYWYPPQAIRVLPDQAFECETIEWNRRQTRRQRLWAVATSSHVYSKVP
jgi:hypothetical protein